MAAFARATGMSCADPPLWNHLGSNSIELGGPRWRRAAVASGIAPERFSASGRLQRPTPLTPTTSPAGVSRPVGDGACLAEPGRTGPRAGGSKLDPWTASPNHAERCLTAEAPRRKTVASRRNIESMGDV
jgi:hypothetical protein